MPAFPKLIPDFHYRTADDESDEKLLSNVRTFGWHLVGIADDDEGPGFAFTVGLYLRTLEPEILIMGLSMESSFAILNLIGEYVREGGVLIPGERYPDFIDGFDVMFSQVGEKHYREYLGSASWFYRGQVKSFPVLQCFWPDKAGLFPDEPGFDARFAGRQIDLSR